MMQVYYRTANIIQRAAWLPLRVIFSFFIKMEFRGVDNVKKIDTNVIFAANHANEFDPLIIVSCLPFFSRYLPLIFVSREKNFYGQLGWRGKIYGGIFFKLMGAFQAYTGLKNYEQALSHHVEALEHGCNICIFPVGKRHADEDVYKAKGGVSYLSEKTNTPIVPVRIKGVEKMSSVDFWKRKRKLIVTFGEPLNCSDLFCDRSTGNKYEAAALSLMENIVALN